MGRGISFNLPVVRSDWSSLLLSLSDRTYVVPLSYLYRASVVPIVVHLSFLCHASVILLSGLCRASVVPISWCPTDGPVLYLGLRLACFSQEDAAGPSDPHVPGDNVGDPGLVRPKASPQLVELVQVISVSPLDIEFLGDRL